MKQQTMTVMSSDEWWRAYISAGKCEPHLQVSRTEEVEAKLGGGADRDV
jgi:hypothetical protein